MLNGKLGPIIGNEELTVLLGADPAICVDWEIAEDAAVLVFID